MRPSPSIFPRLGALALTAGLALLPLTSKAQEAKPVDTSRIVAIGGAVTEIVYALGEEKRLIARDSTSLYPPEVTKLPDVGYMRQLSPEGVLATNPTAILAIEGSGPPDALAVLKSASVPVAMVPDRFSRDGILEKIDAIGAVLHVEDKAKALHDSVAADLDKAIAVAEERPQAERKRVLFILSLQNGKVMASGTGTAADGIIRLSGLVNAAGDFPGYKAMTDEAIVEAKPDVILMMDRGGNHDATVQEIVAHPALGLTPAASHKAVIRMDGLHLLGFGPRTASAVRDLIARVYGG